MDRLGNSYKSIVTILLLGLVRLVTECWTDNRENREALWFDWRSSKSSCSDVDGGTPFGVKISNVKQEM